MKKEQKIKLKYGPEELSEASKQAYAMHFFFLIWPILVPVSILPYELIKLKPLATFPEA